MLDELHELESAGLAQLQDVADADALERWRITYLGTKGRIKAIVPAMKMVPSQDRPAVGSGSTR